MRQRFVTNKSALMVESVDTRDLKSLGPKGRAGSTPAWGTFLFKQELPNICKLDVRQFLFFFFCPHFPHISSLGSRPRQRLTYTRSENLFQKRNAPFPTSVWPILAKIGHTSIAAYPFLAKIGYAPIGESTLPADRMLFPTKAYPFSAKIGYAPIDESTLTADRVLFPIAEYPFSANFGHTQISESTVTADKVLFPVEAYPFSAKIGHSSIAAYPFLANFGHTPSAA